MNGKTVLAFIAGIAAGAALGSYLSSEKGKKTRDNLKEMLGDLGGELNEFLANGKNKFSDIAKEFKDGTSEAFASQRKGMNGNQ
jgi:hypothetical protein